jgi:hypothetical protein
MVIRTPVLDLLSSAGPLPLTELNLRTRMSPELLLEDLASLLQQGLIDVEGGLPETPEQLPNVGRMVRLTTKGITRFSS